MKTKKKYKETWFNPIVHDKLCTVCRVERTYFEIIS